MNGEDERNDTQSLQSCLRGAGFAWLKTGASRFRANRYIVASRVLAGALAAALLVLELLASDQGFHQAFHHNGKPASNNCVLCLFAEGQVELPQSSPVTTTFVRAYFDPAPKTESITLVGFTYLASPSRAPPAPASSLPAV